MAKVLIAGRTIAMGVLKSIGYTFVGLLALGAIFGDSNDNNKTDAQSSNSDGGPPDYANYASQISPSRYDQVCVSAESSFYEENCADKKVIWDAVIESFDSDRRIEIEADGRNYDLFLAKAIDKSRYEVGSEIRFGGVIDEPSGRAHDIRYGEILNVLKSASEVRKSSCRTNWKACESTSDLIENNNMIGPAKYRCKSAAEDKAKYGEPEWPWFAFGSYYEDSDALENGRLSFVEADAKFQNGYGAYKHVEVECVYDLIEDRVAYVRIR